MPAYKIFCQWLPVIDKHRYRPLSVSVDFLQNLFDIIFLLVFIWYWNWGPLLVVLYYVIETMILCLFTSLKWWRSKARLSEERDLSTPTFKVISIFILCSVIGIFSYGQLVAVHDALGLVMSLPPWEVILSDEKQFLIGVLAIVLVQATEYYKYQRAFENPEVELVTFIFTPLMRIVVQQFAVILGILAIVVVSFVDLKAASIMVAVLLGVIKLIFGQLQLTVKK